MHKTVIYVWHGFNWWFAINPLSEDPCLHEHAKNICKSGINKTRVLKEMAIQIFIFSFE
jgi:hypothetical protein